MAVASKTDIAELLHCTAVEMPDWWIETFLGCQLWGKQKEIARSVFQNQRTTVRSCEGSGKTYIASRVALCFLYNFHPATVITTSPSHRQVTEVMWREIANAHAQASRKISMPGQLLQQKLQIADDWFAIGFSTDKLERFLGLHNDYILIIGDDASGIEEPAYDGMENPLATGKVKRQLLIGNPTQPVGRFRDSFTSEFFNPIHISAFDTPNFTAFGITLEDIKSGEWKEKQGGRELPFPFLLSPEVVAQRYIREGEGSFTFQAFVMGNFPEAGVNNLFPIHLIEAAMSRKPEVKTEARKVMALDVARYGADMNVLGIKQGNVVMPFQEWGQQDTMFTAGRTARVSKENKAVVTRIDSVGVGGGVVDRLKEAGIPVQDVNVGQKALDSERFGNQRAENYWHLLELLQDEEEPLVLPYDPLLKAQLADVRFKYNSKGQMFVESKEEMRARGSKSPDRADCLMMLGIPLRLRSGKPKSWRW